MSKKLTRKQRQRGMLGAAAKAPLWVRALAANTVTVKQHNAYRNRRLGKLGPASAVRHIDPREA